MPRLTALLDVLRRRVELLALHDARPALVTLQQFGHFRGFWYLCPLGLSGRVEDAHGPVVARQVFGGDSVDIRGGHFLDAIAMQEEETPVAAAGPFAQPNGKPVGFVHQFFAEFLVAHFRPGRLRLR